MTRDSSDHAKSLWLKSVASTPPKNLQPFVQNEPPSVNAVCVDSRVSSNNRGKAKRNKKSRARMILQKSQNHLPHHSMPLPLSHSYQPEEKLPSVESACVLPSDALPTISVDQLPPPNQCLVSSTKSGDSLDQNPLTSAQCSDSPTPEKPSLLHSPESSEPSILPTEAPIVTHCFIFRCSLFVTHAVDALFLCLDNTTKMNVSELCTLSCGSYEFQGWPMKKEMDVFSCFLSLKSEDYTFFGTSQNSSPSVSDAPMYYYFLLLQQMDDGETIQTTVPNTINWDSVKNSITGTVEFPILQIDDTMVNFSYQGQTTISQLCLVPRHVALGENTSRRKYSLPTYPLFSEQRQPEKKSDYGVSKSKRHTSKDNQRICIQQGPPPSTPQGGQVIGSQYVIPSIQMQSSPVMPYPIVFSVPSPDPSHPALFLYSSTSPQYNIPMTGYSSAEPHHFSTPVIFMDNGQMYFCAPSGFSSGTPPVSPNNP